MESKFGARNWRDHVPTPIFDEYKECSEIYNRAWELAFDHIKDIPGMPQTPYMDEAFCKTQVWIWDSCFMSLFCKYAGNVFPSVETFNNFYKPLYEGAKLPIIYPPKNEPEWTGAVFGKPFGIQVHIADNPPLFAWAEYENALFSGDKEHIRELLEERKILQKHYEFLEDLKESKEIEGVYAPTCWKTEKFGYKWEGGRSGMDNTPRGRIGETAKAERPNNPDMLWIDAICQQAMAADMISRLFGILNDEANRDLWKARYEEKKKIVNELYWDDENEFYYDIDCNTHDFYRVMTVASLWTMTSRIATNERAEALVKRVMDPDALGGEVPLLSLARNDNDFSPSGKYWRGSLWLPTAYASLKGLANYGYFDVARDAAIKIVRHMLRVYKEYSPHTIWECYSPNTPEPGRQTDDKEIVRKDFCGWSALGPISVYIEFVLGFHYVNAFEKKVKWAIPKSVNGEIGIRNLHFGEVKTDIISDGKLCTVTSNEEYTLEINGVPYEIKVGNNQFVL